MVSARKRKKLTQAQLAAKVGTSQNTITMIESGRTLSSDRILKICEVLRIPPPMHFVSKEQERWAILGHLFEEQHPKEFEATLNALTVRFAEELASLESEHAELTPKTPRASANANTAIPPGKREAGPLRGADELPIEAAARKKKP